MIKINDMFRGIVLNPNVLETESVKLDDLKAEEYGLSYQNSNMRVECHNRGERASWLTIEVFGNEEIPANRITIENKNVDDCEITTFTLEEISGDRVLGSITFENQDHDELIRVSTANKHVDFGQRNVGGRLGITRYKSLCDDDHFFCVDSITTGFVLRQMRNALCDINIFDAKRDLYIECIDRMFEIIKPALVLNILVFNERLLNKMESAHDMLKDLSCNDSTSKDRINKDIMEADYQYFLDTFESEVPDTMNVKK